MLNIPKQIDYWRTTAENDIETAAILISEGSTSRGCSFAI